MNKHKLFNTILILFNSLYYTYLLIKINYNVYNIFKFKLEAIQFFNIKSHQDYSRSFKCDF